MNDGVPCANPVHGGPLNRCISIVFVSVALGIMVASVACTSNVVKVTRSAAPDPNASDAGDPTDPAVPADPAPPTGLPFAATCHHPSDCAAGLTCLTEPGATFGICVQLCSSSKKCTGKAQCFEEGYCMLPCSGGCPSGSNCVGGACTPSCEDREDMCGKNAFCMHYNGDVYGCATTPGQPPPPDPCTTPTTTPTSGVSGTKTVGELSAVEAGTLCDWAAGREGGYGCKHTCTGGTSTTNKSAAACNNVFKATCPATVAQVEACTVAISADPCDLTVALGAACKPLTQAGCQ